MSINSKLKLNNIYSKNIDSISMRKGFGEGLVKAGAKNKDVVALCADLTESVQMQAFKENFEERFFDVGVAEQNLVTVASGMASMGKIPFTGSYAVFSPGRNWEQIRTTICINNSNVKIIGSHAGLNVGPDGATHQMLEDIALMRVLPNMVVISPCDAIEAEKATLAIAGNGKPSYMRLAREKTPIITTEHTPFEIGKAQIVFDNESKKLDVAIIATGWLLYKALLVAKKLEDGGIKVAVVNVSTIKPLDADTIISIAHRSGAVVTVEEHQVIGGLGSAVAECLSTSFPVPVEFVGIKDQFGQSGKMDELVKHYNIDESDIEKAVHRVMVRK